MAVMTSPLSPISLEPGHKTIYILRQHPPAGGSVLPLRFPEGGLPVAKKLYVGNLSYDMTDSDLQTLFEQFGAVQSVQIIMDRDTGRSKGFGFVEMSSPQEAQAAIDGLNGKEVNG